MGNIWKHLTCVQLFLEVLERDAAGSLDFQSLVQFNVAAAIVVNFEVEEANPGAELIHARRSLPVS